MIFMSAMVMFLAKRWTYSSIRIFLQLLLLDLRSLLVDAVLILLDSLIGVFLLPFVHALLNGLLGEDIEIGYTFIDILELLLALLFLGNESFCLLQIGEDTGVLGDIGDIHILLEVNNGVLVVLKVISAGSDEIDELGVVAILTQILFGASRSS